MRNIILMASAAAMGIAMPALAKPGNGHGASVKAKQSTTVKTNGANVRTSARLDANANGILDRFERDTDRDGIPDYREGTLSSSLDRNSNGILDRYESGGRVNMCPPGLAKKSPACIPPGQAKRSFAAGQRLPSGYRYVPVPQQYIGQIPNYDPNLYRYYYGDNRVYVVNPTTSLIDRVIDLIR
jgi:hypothetical protein